MARHERTSLETEPSARRRILGLSERRFALLMLYAAPAPFAGNMLMLLLPFNDGVLAFLLLRESLETYHPLGAALVPPGTCLATRPTVREERSSGRPARD